MATKDKQTDKDTNRKPADQDQRRSGQDQNERRDQREGFNEERDGTSLGDVER